jgi:hypothetical protein
MKQIEVSRNNVKRITWTDEDAKIKSGNSIKFKNEEHFWNIDKVHSTSLEKAEINRSWHVGGL